MLLLFSSLTRDPILIKHIIRPSGILCLVTSNSRLQEVQSAGEAGALLSYAVIMSQRLRDFEIIISTSPLPFPADSRKCSCVETYSLSHLSECEPTSWVLLKKKKARFCHRSIFTSQNVLKSSCVRNRSIFTENPSLSCSFPPGEENLANYGLAWLAAPEGAYTAPWDGRNGWDCVMRLISRRRRYSHSNVGNDDDRSVSFPSRSLARWPFMATWDARARALDCQPSICRDRAIRDLAIRD